MTGDKDDEVGGQIIRTMVIQFFITHAATIHDFEERLKHPSFATMRTAATQAAREGTTEC